MDTDRINSTISIIRCKKNPCRILSQTLSAGVLETDIQGAVLTYVARVSEDGFPAYFDMALIARLASEFCIPLTESTTRADMLARQAEGAFRAARLADSQQSEPPSLEDFTLVEVRG
jgi:hypothetical protein